MKSCENWQELARINIWKKGENVYGGGLFSFLFLKKCGWFVTFARSHIYDKVEDEDEGQQVAEKEDYSTLVLIVSTTNEINEALGAVVSVVVLCYSEAHYDTNNKAAEVTEVIHICLSQTNLNVEKEDQ